MTTAPPPKDILVYVQAMLAEARQLSSPARLSELSNSEFRMTHSSKVALSVACSVAGRLGAAVAAAGYGGILSEALARGANTALAVPLCESAIEQADSLRSGRWRLIFAGENPEGLFSGATLLGALTSRSARVALVAGSPQAEDLAELPYGSAVLVSDDGGPATPIDIRRIRSATAVDFEATIKAGRGLLSKHQSRPDANTPVLRGSADEVASAISRKLRKYRGS